MVTPNNPFGPSATPQDLEMEKAADDTVQNEKVRTVVVHTTPIGSSGIRSFAGYPSEDYLDIMHGRRKADIFDKMRRSESEVKMIISAVKNPIKSATWEIEPAGDDPQSQQISDLVTHVLFKDMDKPFDQFLAEALTVVEFGHAAFEVIHKVVLNNPKFGNYTGIRQIAFRSQRTLERWNLDKDTGGLVSISQYAYGDLQRLVDIPADFLLVFSIDMEGDNYEGISMLRTCYGPWLRKGTYQKLMAIGIERFAIPTPVGTVPAGKENTDQAAEFEQALADLVSHEKNYLVIPAGWSVDIKSNTFDPDKVQKAIDGEDKAMVKAFLANFLELGMASASGSYAMSFNQSDFFLSGIEHIATAIASVINLKLIPEIVKMKYGPQDAYPSLKHSGISDKAGLELSTALKNLSDSKVIVPDDQLEAGIRKRFRLPAKSKLGQRFGGQIDQGEKGVDGAPAHTEGAGHQFSEKGVITLSEKNPRQLITSGKSDLKAVMQENLKAISQDLVKQIMTKVRKLPESQQLDAIKNLKFSGTAAYKQALLECLGSVAAKALSQARKEVPKAKSVKLSERLKLADFDDLPNDVKKKVQTQAGLLVDTQMADIEKAVYFSFTHSVDSTDSDSILESDLTEAADSFIEGSGVEAASGTVTALIVNQSRNAFFFDDDVSDQIDSFTFSGGAGCCPLCDDLVGTTFSKDDPNADRYYPPLHHNCSHYLTPNLSGSSKSIDPDGLQPSSPSLDQYMTLSEGSCGHVHRS